MFAAPSVVRDSAPERQVVAALPPDAIQVVSAAVLRAIAATETPQGLVAVFPRRLSPAASASRLLLVLDGLQDPGNVGTILRSALGSGLVETVVVRGGADPFGPKAVRAAAAALFALRIAQPDEAELRAALDGRTVWIADAAGAERYDRLDWRQPGALVVGSEAHGASRLLRQMADGQVSVPLRGGLESLNAAVAVSIMLFEAARQHFPAG